MKHLQNINKISLINQSAYRRSARSPSECFFNVSQTLASPTQQASEATKQLPIV